VIAGDLEKAGDVVGGRGQVGVGHVAPVTGGCEESVADGGALAAMGQGEQAHARVGGDQIANDVGSPIPAPVVGHDDLPRGGEGLERGAQLLHARGNASLFVVGRHDHRECGRGRDGSGSRAWQGHHHMAGTGAPQAPHSVLESCVVTLEIQPGAVFAEPTWTPPR
jgi:hypothetical protein